MCSSEKPSSDPVVLTPVFKLIFLTTLSLTVLSLGVSLFLSFQGKLSVPQANLFETCATTWKMGFGTIIGLIGGKAT